MLSNSTLLPVFHQLVNIDIISVNYFLFCYNIIRMCVIMNFLKKFFIWIYIFHINVSKLDNDILNCGHLSWIFD